MAKLMVKWPKVVEGYDDPILKWIDLCNATLFRVAAFKTYSPRHCFVVAIERIGCFAFPMDKFLSWGYVSEKLFLPEPDARNMADWINAQIDKEGEQQGHYSRDMLAEIEPYGLGGEIKEMPLIPKAISD